MTTEAKPAKAAELPLRLALFQLVTGHYVSHAIYVAAKLGIADLLAGGPKHFEELAKATGTHAPSLNRLLRLLASVGVFAEQENGSFALTPVAELLRSDTPGSSRHVAMLFVGPLMRSWNELLHSVQAGEPAFARAFGTDPFKYMSQHAEEAAIFDAAMTGTSAQTASAVVGAYDFSSFKQIVDVGGGQGALLTGILKANPNARGVLFDLPHVVANAKKVMESAGVTARCEVVGGDFFEGVPQGGDAYILKAVIHDWDDARSVAILKKCREAMQPQGRLLLAELVFPARVEASVAHFFAAGSDVNMMVNVGGRERTESEFRALYEAAGFRLTKIFPTQGSLANVIEGVRT